MSNSSTSRLSIRSLSISYYEAGPQYAPVVIFIHGFPLDQSMWNAQVNALDKYRIITYDIRGHGRSDAGSAPFSIDLFAQDLIEIMDELNIDYAALCGLSMGGYIALNALHKYPNRFKALILCDTQCVADTDETRQARIKAIDSLKLEGIEKYADDNLKRLFSAAAISTGSPAVAEVRKMITGTSVESISKTLMALAERRETCSTLGEIKVPVLIIAGREDSITPPSTAQYMQERIPGSVLYIIDGAGHMSNLEKPAEFNQQLLRFLDQSVGW